MSTPRTVTDPCWLGLAAIAAAYRDRTLSPLELAHALLTRIDRLDPVLRGFVLLDREAMLTEADDSGAAFDRGEDRGVLHGIPIGIKDVIDVAGQPTTCHSAILADAAPAVRDAAVVARLRATGAIISGKLATHEFAIGGPAFDLPFPPARNPWNSDHHPGGSSSGAGAVVAAGLLPGAIGTDTAGSIRNPASACGIVGLKPTYGAVPTDGVFPLAHSLDHVGPLARTVADAALLFSVMAGRAVPPIVAGSLRGVRIGVVRHFHETDMACDIDVTRAFDEAVVALPPLEPQPYRGGDATIMPDPAMLFRFSALTYNAHRIHYDLPYARGVEGYRGLVVHGPLIATLLMDRLLRKRLGAAVTHFTFRAVAPLFAGEQIAFTVDYEYDVAILQALGPAGVGMTAKALFSR